MTIVGASPVGASPDAFAATSRPETPPVRGRIHDQMSSRAPGSPRTREAVPGSRKPRSQKPRSEKPRWERARPERAKAPRGGDAVIVVRFDKRRRSSGGQGRPEIIRAVKLRVPHGLRRRLGDVYYEEFRNQPDVRRRDIVGPVDIHYGKVVQRGRPRVVFYAIGDTALFGEFFDPKLLPHVWRKPGSDRRWTYVGDTPHGTCGRRLVPRRLANAWDVKCSG